MLEVLRQVKVNISLLHMIKQVPTYAKFLKDLCTVKIGLNVNKKTFLTEQVSAIIECKTPVKYKDPGCPTISVNIGGISVEKALLDLGASVNLLPYSMYKQLGLGELKPTSITLSLADRSIKIPKGTIEDVLIQVDRFYYPVDFVVLDTEPVAVGANHVPIILGRPFLATSNAIINCRNGVMQLTFGNMTLELTIFFFFWMNKNLFPKGQTPTKNTHEVKKTTKKRKTDSTSPKTEEKGHQPETKIHLINGSQSPTYGHNQHKQPNKPPAPNTHIRAQPTKQPSKTPQPGESKQNQ